ncbi:major facilitator superfamily domain-containing protein [Pelagophyceae sp. CCMP2097]|nr:major facilitator superfamily domain-containing protein [Pelagophyceae sp. CCMP2097]
MCQQDPLGRLPTGRKHGANLAHVGRRDRSASKPPRSTLAPAPSKSSHGAAPQGLSTSHAKMLSFLYSASGVAWNRFCNLYLLNCGFKPREIGAMKSLSLFGKLFAQPMWAAFADTGSPPYVLAFSVVCSTIALEILRLGTRQGFYGGATVHWSTVAALRCFRSMTSAASPVADAMVLALARSGGEAWGRQRFWGSASWGAGSLLVGILIDAVGLEWGLFGSSYLISVGLASFLVFKMAPKWATVGGASRGEAPGPPQDDGEAGDDEPLLKDEASAKKHHRTEAHASPPAAATEAPAEASSDDVEGQLTPDNGAAAKKRAPKSVSAVIARGALALRRSAALRLALANAAVFGAAVVTVDAILYMQLEELGVSRSLNGLATAVSTLSTFPVFWSSAKLVQHYGHWRLLLIAQCILPVRLLLHACMTAENVHRVLLPIQLLHGPMFAGWLSAAVELVDRLAPAELRASTQSLLTMSYFTLGGAVGHLCWSAAYDMFGARLTYVYGAAFSASTTLGFAYFALPYILDDAVQRSGIAHVSLIDILTSRSPRHPRPKT